MKRISLIHVVNLRDKIVVEQFTLEGLEEKLAQQKSVLKSMGFEVDSELVFGIPHLELERYRKEKGADVIIVGSHGRTSAASTIGGTIADVLQNMKAPVLVVPLKKQETDDQILTSRNLFQYEQILKELEKEEPDWLLKSGSMTNHILIPTDFSDFSENAYQLIKNQQVKLPRLTFLHVQDEVKIGKYLADKLEEFNRIDSERLQRLADSFSSAHPETSIDLRIIYGKPIQVILKYIKENGVSLTVMGSQGRGFLAEVFIGSVSHQVTRNATSNMMIVPLKNEN